MVASLVNVNRYTSLSADESAALLTRKLRRKEPFFFVRYGDGAIECIRRGKGQTCDGEKYSVELGRDLLACWQSLLGHSRVWIEPSGIPAAVYVGDWLSATFEHVVAHTVYAEEYAELIGDAEPTGWLHFESLLLMRESAELLDFYRAVARDSRQKLFMGPAECWGAAKILHADHLVTPMRDLYGHVDHLASELMERKWDVLLYGAGMAGSIPAIRCREEHPERTYINVGSAFDPLFRGKTRRQQISTNRAKEFFRELL
jgi:hypothetical protein